MTHEPLNGGNGNAAENSHSVPQWEIKYQHGAYGTKLTIDVVTLGEFREKHALDHTGVNIYYLPSIQHMLLSDSKIRGDDDPPLLGTDGERFALRDHLTREYRIPEFFWQRMGWDANGFFSSKANVVGETENVEYESHCSQSRFLMKEVQELVNQESLEYHWRYLAFCTLWFRTKTAKKGKVSEDRKQGSGKETSRSKRESTLILLCFDLNEEYVDKKVPEYPLQESFGAHFEPGIAEELSICPYGIFDKLLQVVVSQSNRANWTFRKPVRNVEKTNDPKMNEETKNRVGRYRHMHELSRHVIHASETLAVATRTVSDIIRSADMCEGECCREKEKRDVSRNLNFYASFLDNLKQRAQSFDQRMRNEIRLAFNLVDAEDTENTKEILRETRNDGRELTNFVSALSVVFLPPTFVAGFFGMNFFEFGWRQCWMYFAVTVPLSLVAFISWVVKTGGEEWRFKILQDWYNSVPRIFSRCGKEPSLPA